jgi:hypothetical protein
MVKGGWSQAWMGSVTGGGGALAVIPMIGMAIHATADALSAPCGSAAVHVTR